MLNRRHIRVKILQILYSQNRAKSPNKELYNFFNATTKKFYQFFITQLHFFVLIKQETIRQFYINKKKYYKSENSEIVNFITSEWKRLKKIYKKKINKKKKSRSYYNFFHIIAFSLGISSDHIFSKS